MIELDIVHKEKIGCIACGTKDVLTSTIPVLQKKDIANCLVCSNEVEYLSDAVDAICYYCGQEEETYLICREGHYVCNKCHSRDALDVIENICLKTNLDDPLIIAERIMEHPGIHMHGPEHHALVPAVLAAAYGNHVEKDNRENVLEAIKRGKKVPGGYCGLYGACGAGVGVGVAVSILLKATPLTPDERSLANWATSRTLNSIAVAGGARCCKKATRIALGEGMAYISKLFGLEWYERSDFSVKCNYTQYNRECDMNCRYRRDA